MLETIGNFILKLGFYSRQILKINGIIIIYIIGYLINYFIIYECLLKTIFKNLIMIILYSIFQPQLKNCFMWISL